MKAKQLLLGFGFISTIAPIATMISCSSSEEAQDTKRIEKQAEKFTYSQSTSLPRIKTVRASQKVNLAPASEKIKELEDFTRDGFLPVLDDGFDFEILSSNANKLESTILDVIIRIFEINNQENEKIIILEVTEFWDLSALDWQLIKFVNTEKTNNDNIDAESAVAYILAFDDRKVALNILADVPSVDSPKFAYEVKDVKISNRDPNEIYVTITVIENPGVDDWKEDVIFAINGFKSTT
ncbi:MAG: phage tail tube assembly chaperone [Metamycoplasmataceae bacterium]